MRMKERVIVKYNPKYYDIQGVYTKDEWTDFSDVGREFEGKRLSIEEYLVVENNFIAFVRECLELIGCKYLTIDWNWWNGDKKSYRDSIKSNCKLDPNFEETEYLALFNEVEVKNRVSIPKSMCLFRLMLRCSLGISLSNRKRKIKLYMGYEYYLHFFTCIDSEVLSEKARKYNLYLVW